MYEIFQKNLQENTFKIQQNINTLSRTLTLKHGKQYPPNKNHNISTTEHTSDKTVCLKASTFILYGPTSLQAIK